MISHPTKQLNLKPQNPGATQQWGFPGAPVEEPKAQPQSILTPEQRVIKKESPADAWGLEQVGKTDAEKDADFYSVKLPSDFYFYDFKALSVKKVTGRVQAKFTRAGAEGNARYLVEGVSFLLGDGISALDLTAYDFKWLLHFILLLSYPASPRRTAVECRNPEHHQKVDDGEMSEASLNYVMTYDRPTLKEIIFDPKALEALDLTPLNGYDLGVYTMRDAIEWEENYSDRSDNEEDVFIYDLAAYLKGGTLEERAEKVRDMSVSQFKCLEAYRAVAQNHGVTAALKSICKECGAENVTDVTISVRDFL